MSRLLLTALLPVQTQVATLQWYLHSESVRINQIVSILQDALAQFQMLRAAGRMRGVMRLMPDKVLASLLQKLSAGKMPAEVLRMLTAMSVDGRRMPAVDESIADSTARSFLTSWLAGPRLDLTASQGFEGAACCTHACLSMPVWCLMLCCQSNGDGFGTLWKQIQLSSCTHLNSSFRQRNYGLKGGSFRV